MARLSIKKFGKKVEKNTKDTVNRTRSGLKDFLKKLGPGVVTGAADDDPSGIATYSQAGAMFGLATLWTAFITAPLMISIQEMCARIGIVTHHGLANVIKKNYNVSILYLVLLLTIPAIIFNIAADIAAVGAVANLLVPQLPAILFSFIFTGVLAAIVIVYPYRKFASLMKWLCISLFAYFVVPFLLKVNWDQIARSAIFPTIQFNSSFILIIVALFGTTISPYLFFWQAAMEVEEDRQYHKRANNRLIKNMEADVYAGMIFSNVVMFFIILTTGSVLFTHNITNITTVQQAATALKPLAGNASYLLFAIGVLGSACIALPVLGGGLSYIYSEISETVGSLDGKFHQERGFYLVLIISFIAGLLIDLAGVNPITMLIYSAVLYGLIAPILIVVILHICNNKRILGEYVNDRLSNILGIATFLIMAFAAIAFLYLQFI